MPPGRARRRASRPEPQRIAVSAFALAVVAPPARRFDVEDGAVERVVTERAGAVRRGAVARGWAFAAGALRTVVDRLGAARAGVAAGVTTTSAVLATTGRAAAPAERELINCRAPFSLIRTVWTWAWRTTSRCPGL